MKHWLKALAVACLLAVPLAAVLTAPVQAATVTVAVAGTADTTTSPNASAAFTPAENDLLVVCLSASNTTQDPGTISDSTGMTFTQFAKAGFSAGATQRLYGFVSDSLVTAGQAVSQTVTANFVTDDFGGTVISVARVSGMTAVGLSAVRQFDITDDGAASGTPATTFASAALTGNPTIYCVGNETNPAGLTEPSSWTEGGDAGYATPTSGMEWAYRNSGFTGTTITSGGTSASAFDALAVELAATSIPTFTAGPTLGTPTATTLPTTFTLSETGTVYGVACPDGQAAPTVAQVKAGNCTGDVAAVNAWSEAVVATVGDSHSFTGLTHSTIYDLSFAATGTTLDTAAISSIANATTICGSTPSVSSVDGDDSFDAADASIAIAGSNLCNTHATATVVLRDGSANDKTLTCSVFTNTQWTCSGASAVGMGVVNGLKYGALTLRFTNDAGNLGTKAVTVTAPSGTKYADLVTPVALSWDSRGAPSRPFGYPLDLEAASQLALRNAVGCTIATDVTINTDGSLVLADTCTAVDFDFSRSLLYVGTVATQGFSGLRPQIVGTPISNLTFSVDLAISAQNLGALFGPGDAALSSYALKSWTTSTNRTLVNGAIAGSLLLVVDAVTNLVKGDYIDCGTNGPVEINYVDPFNLQLGLVTALTCADNDQVAERGVGAGAVTGLSMAAGTGIVTGTPTVLGAVPELFARATDAAALFSDSNEFSITIQAQGLSSPGTTFNFGFRF